MLVQEVMTTDVVTIRDTAPLKEAARQMVEAGVGGLPVLDQDGAMVGIISEADFLKREAASAGRFRLLGALLRKQEVPEADTVGEAMSRGPKTIGPDAELGEAARRMVRHSVKRLPVVDRGGALVGIVSRADVMEAFARADGRIADEINDDIVDRILGLDPAAVSLSVQDGVVRLAGSTPTWTDRRTLVELAKRVDGVIRVDSEDVRFELDDRLGSDPTAPRL